MLFEIDRASHDSRALRELKPYDQAFRKDGDNQKWWVEVKSLEDLLALRDAIGEELILGDCNTITIYDTNIE